MSFEWIIKEPEKDVADAEDDSLFILYLSAQSRAEQCNQETEEKRERGE